SPARPGPQPGKRMRIDTTPEPEMAPRNAPPRPPHGRHHPRPPAPWRPAARAGTMWRWARATGAIRPPAHGRPAFTQGTSAMWNLHRVAAALVMLLATTAALATTPAPTSARADAVAIIGELRKIVAPSGVERYDYLPIGGINQFVSIRGQ